MKSGIAMWVLALRTEEELGTSAEGLSVSKLMKKEVSKQREHRDELWCADPYDGWCGEGRLATVPYPIMPDLTDDPVKDYPIDY